MLKKMLFVTMIMLFASVASADWIRFHPVVERPVIEQFNLQQYMLSWYNSHILPVEENPRTYVIDNPWKYWGIFKPIDGCGKVPTNPVPEPSTMLLLGVGLFFLARKGLKLSK